MFRYRIPDILRFVYPKAVWRCSSHERCIYLTFDDGCVPEVTPKVLEILENERIKATFFCVGENVEKYPLLFKELQSRGHQVGNHTYNHLKGINVSSDDYLANIARADKLIGNKLFRPPYGRITPVQMKALRDRYGYKIILWDLITNDFNKNLSPSEIMRNIKRYTRNGSIVVFHDSVKAAPNMLAVLPEAIKWWKEEGYEFRTL